MYNISARKVYRSDFHGITAARLKQRLGATEVMNCDIFGRGGFDACAAAARLPTMKVEP